MSLGQDPTFERSEARKEAERILRFKIGPQYSLGDPKKMEGGGYSFPVLISLPRVIFDEARQNPVDVKYLDAREVGEIEVAGPDEVDYTLPQTIYANVREVEQRIQKVVEKALISAAAKDFTQLPFPENRFAPIEDLLAKITLQGSVSIETISTLEPSEDDNKYSKHLDLLEKNDLIRRENGKIVPGDILASIQRDTDRHSEALNAALAHFFRENINNLDDVHEVLAPYLAIAGFYYRLAIDSDRLPVVTEEELRDAFARHYKGRGRRTELKKFKMSRYLLHLERVGILECHTKSDQRVWSGNPEIKASLEETPYLGTIAEI